MLTLHGTRRVYTSMNLSSLIFILCFYIFFDHYYFVKFWFKSCEEKYNLACLVIMFNSFHHDMTSIERCVTSAIQQLHSSKEIVGECKYIVINCIFLYILAKSTITDQHTQNYWFWCFSTFWVISGYFSTLPYDTLFTGRLRSTI